MGIIQTYQESSRNEEVAVGTSSVVISQAKQQSGRDIAQARKVITIRNTSPNSTDTITVNFGANQAVAGRGIVLKQNESITDSMDGGYMPFQGSITAICATSTGTLAIFER